MKTLTLVIKIIAIIAACLFLSIESTNAKTILSDTPAVDEIEKKIEALIENQRYNEAEILLEQFNSKASCQGLTFQGRIQANKGNFDLAVGSFNECLDEMDGNFEGALIGKAKVLLHLSQTKEALEIINKVIGLYPENKDVYLLSGRAHSVLGNSRESKKMYQKAKEIDPSSPYLWFDLGVRSVATEQFDLAFEEFVKAKELNQSLDMKIVGRIFLQSGEIGLAFKSFEMAGEDIENKPKSEKIEFFNLFGLTAEALYKNGLAEEMYRKVLGIDPDNVEANLHLAQLLTGTGITNLSSLHACGLNTDEAMKHYRLAGSNPMAKDSLDECESHLKQSKEWKSRVENDSIENAEQTTPKKTTTTMFSKLKKGLFSSNKMNHPNDIPKVEIRSTDHFYQDYVVKRLPVVMTNIQNKFSMPEEFCWDKLRERFKGMPVKVSISDSGRFDGPEPGDLWGLSPNEEVLVRPYETIMYFEDFVALVKNNSLNETFYIEYQSVDQYLGEDIKEMIKLPEEIAESELELILKNMWISKGGTVAMLHYDDYENILCQIIGRKELTLFPPNDMGRLYYTARSKGALEYTYPGTFKREQIVDSTKRIFGSSIDLNNPDLDKFPLFRGLKGKKVMLHPGECLFMPSYWHHEVRSFGGSCAAEHTLANVAVNFWYKNTTYFESEGEFLTTKLQPMKAAEL